MMVGLMQFIYRLLNPIEEKNPRMYHFDIAYGQLIGMLLLTLICYQFTIVGEGVYLDAIRAFIRNSSLLVRWESLSLPVGQHEIQLFLEQMGSPREFWNMGRFAWVIGKVIFMACIIIVYAVAQQRKFYVRTVTTGILHIMSFAQLVVALITFADFNFGTINTASNHWLLYDCAMCFKYRIIVTNYGTYCGSMY